MTYVSLTELAAYQAKLSEDFSITIRGEGNKEKIAFNFPRKIIKALGIIKGDRIDILFDPAVGEGIIKRSINGYKVFIDKNGRGSITITYRPGLPKPLGKRYLLEYYVDGTTNEVLFTFSPEIFKAKED